MELTLNEKFKKITGLTLDIEKMIAECPVEEKEDLYRKLDWRIGLLLSTSNHEGKFTSDGSEKAETLKEIYNLLIASELTDEETLEEIFSALKDGEHKSISISENKELNGVILANGSVTLNVAKDTKLDTTKSTTQVAFTVNGGKLEVDSAGEIIASKTGTSKGSRLFAVNGDGELRIDSGKFVGNYCVNANGGKTTVNNGEFLSQEPTIAFFNSETAKPTELIINGGTFEAADNAVIMGNGTKLKEGAVPSKVKINGGVYNCNIKSAGYIACGIYNPNIDEIEIDGATFNITDGCCICSRAGKVTIKNSVINMKYTDKVLESGKVGDSRIVVPCVPFVFDEAAKYPGLNSDSQIIIGENVTINYEGEYVHKDKKAALVVMGEDNTSKTIFSDSTEFNAEGQSRIVFK